MGKASSAKCSGRQPVTGTFVVIALIRVVSNLIQRLVRSLELRKGGCVMFFNAKDQEL